MEQRLCFFGVGPRLVVSTLLYAGLAGVATHLWPGACLLTTIPCPVFTIAGTLLILLGVPLWILGGIGIARAYRSDRLVTTGAFALCRHPVYGSWIVLIAPGLVLLSRSWPVMLTPIVAYGVFKRLIRKEDEYLRVRFGAPYLEYRARVNELIPFPRR